MLDTSFSESDPNVWSGRAVQEVFVDPADAVLHQCIRPLFGAVVLRVIMDISAHAISLAERPRAGYLGHQGSHAPGRPVLHCRLILSQNSAGKVGVTSSLTSWLCAVPLFVPGGRSFVPTCGSRAASRVGPVKVGRRTCLASRASVARPHLDGPEHGARLKPAGTLLHWS